MCCNSVQFYGLLNAIFYLKKYSFKDFFEYYKIFNSGRVDLFRNVLDEMFCFKAKFFKIQTLIFFKLCRVECTNVS